MKSKVILVVLIFAVFLAVALIAAPKEEAKRTLTVWGPLEASESGWQQIAEAYSRKHADVRIVYRRIAFDDYDRTLLAAFALQQAPDVFYIQNTAVPRMHGFLTPMPQGAGWMTYREYTETFVDVVATDFTRDQQHIFAIPLFMETLALFYNKALVQEPPKTWEAFDALISDLTELDSNGAFIRSAAAIGTAKNINRATDLFSLLALQRLDGGTMNDPETGRTRIDPQSEEARSGDALRAYTKYANPSLPGYTWNPDQWYSIDAFNDGRVAMMFNYPHHLSTVLERAPNLDLGIALMPQPKSLLDKKLRIDYANYWGLAVSTQSLQSKAAWGFVRFMGEFEQQRQASIRYTANPVPASAHRRVIEGLLDEPLWGVFAQQALTARSWYQPDGSAVEVLLEEAIEDVVRGENPNDRTERLERDIRLLHENLVK